MSPIYTAMPSLPINTASITRRLWITILVAAPAYLPAAQAQLLERAAPPPPRSVLVRNVTLINQPDQAGDVVVSLLIRAGELEVVTQDAVATDAVDLALDAAGGILVGNLQTGEPASFLILEGDPREDIQVLLDTARTVSFAVAKGEIVRNRLARAFDADDAPQRSAWLAYTPPPLAMPTAYRDASKFNRWETRYVSGIFTAGLVLDRQNWRSQDDASELQVGDLRVFDGGEIRGLRFGTVGTLNFPKPWVYTVFAATNAFDKGFDSEDDDDLTFFDWRLDVPVFAEATLSIGKQKEPISMERLMSMAYSPMQERAAVSDALFPSRNVGLVLSGTAVGRRLTWAAGVFNDWLEDSGSPGDNATQFVGRTSLVPWASPDDSNLFHLGFGFRYTNARQGFFVATEPEFNQSPNFVDTMAFEADDVNLYNLEASWRRGPVWLHGEYSWAEVQNEALGDPRVTGYHLTASWALTGEMRRYNRRNGLFDRLPVARSVYQSGWGTWELATRWSSLDATDGALAGGELDILSAGVNWWLTPFFHVSLNYRWITLDRLGVSGDSHGFNSRVMLLLE